jgi:hypothetical protein
LKWRFFLKPVAANPILRVNDITSRGSPHLN